eukprot:576890-Rhodomonas_salina.2
MPFPTLEPRAVPNITSRVSQIQLYPGTRVPGYSVPFSFSKGTPTPNCKFLKAQEEVAVIVQVFSVPGSCCQFRAAGEYNGNQYFQVVVPECV